MRTLFVSAIFCLGLHTASIAQAAKINWMTIEEVEEAIKTDPKPVMMDVYTSWCGPCKRMKAVTFTNPNVIKYINENYYPIYFDAEHPSSITYKGKEFKNLDYDPNRQGARNGTHQLTKILGVSAFPTIVFFDDNFNIIFPSRGYHDSKQLEVFLKFFNEAYSKDTPKENQQAVFNEFTSTFTPSW